MKKINYFIRQLWLNLIASISIYRSWWFIFPKKVFYSPLLPLIIIYSLRRQMIVFHILLHSFIELSLGWNLDIELRFILQISFDFIRFLCFFGLALKGESTAVLLKSLLKIVWKLIACRLVFAFVISIFLFRMAKIICWKTYYIEIYILLLNFFILSEVTIEGLELNHIF